MELTAQHPHGSVYCARCAHHVSPVRAWSGFVWLKRAWYAGCAVLACLSPIIVSEITVLLPLACTFALAGGPIHALSSQVSTCAECGGPVK